MATEDDGKGSTFRVKLGPFPRLQTRNAADNDEKCLFGSLKGSRHLRAALLSFKGGSFNLVTLI